MPAHVDVHRIGVPTNTNFDPVRPNYLVPGTTSKFTDYSSGDCQCSGLAQNADASDMIDCIYTKEAKR